MFKIETHVFSWLKFHTPPRKDSNSPPLGRGRRSNAYGLPGGTDFEVSIWLAHKTYTDHNRQNTKWLNDITFRFLETVHQTKKTERPPTPTQADDSQRCAVTRPEYNVTLIGGIKSGIFSEAKHVHDMDLCTKHCCLRKSCDLAFMIRDSCYLVRCTNQSLCKTKRARPSNMNPSITFVSHLQSMTPEPGKLICDHCNPKLQLSLKFVSSPQCKYMNFIYLKSLFITWMVYLDPTYWPASTWLASLVGRALHRYRRGHGFKSRTGLNFFQVLFSTISSVVFLAARIS